MTRTELLEKLYQTWWNEIATYDSDSSKYALISYDDTEKLTSICEQIEALDAA